MLHSLRESLKTISPTLGFAVLLAVLYALTYQFSAVLLDPQGIHFIRQSDSLAFASNYYHFGYGLFEPHTFSLATADGAAACEFPLLYYITAFIYHVNGESFSVLRIIHLTVISFGFLAAFQFIHRRIQPFVIAASLTLLLITSTVILYYASNYLVDSAALGFILLGIERFDRFRASGHRRHYGLSVLWLTWACLLKITFSIWPLALFGALLSFKKPFARLSHFALLIPVVCSVFWFAFATLYNRQSGDEYFVTSSIPLWQLNTSETAQLIDAVTHYWIGSYYPPITRWAYLVVLSVLGWKIKRIHRFELRLLGIAGLGIVCYFLLMGRAFINHDYYMLPIVPWIMLLLASTAETMVGHASKRAAFALSLTLLFSCCASVLYVREKLERRYFASTDPFDDAASTLHSAIVEHDLPQPKPYETVLVVGDPTRNGSLLYLKSKGLTYPDLRHFTSAWDNRSIPPQATALYINDVLPEEWTLRSSATLRAQGANWYYYTLNR
jgi:hypothetical protein